MKLKLLAFIMLFFLCDFASAQQQWEQTSGPEGGAVGSIVASPDGNLYAATRRGIYRSDNNGESWTELNNSPISNPPNLTSRLAVNQEGDVFAMFYNSLYRSLDEGNTWELIFTPTSGTLGMIKINSQGDIFISGTAFYLSVDNGDNWTMQNDIDIQAFVFNSEDSLVAASNDSIVTSSDNGATWDFLALTPDEVSVRSMAINSQDHLFIATSDWQVYRTTDDGLSWQPVLDTYYTGQVAINSRDEVFVVFFEYGIQVSKDNGDTWDVINDGLYYSDVWTIAFDSLDNIYAGTPKGVYISTDNGENWLASFNGLNSNLVYSLHTNDEGDIFAVTNSEIYRSVDKGDDWTLIYQVNYDTTITNVKIFPNGDIYVGQYDIECQDCSPGDGHVYRSKDNGDTWEDLYFESQASINCITINENGDIVIVTGSGLHISSDDGETFTQQPNDDMNYCSTLTSSTGIRYKIGYTVIGDSSRSTIDKSIDAGNTWSHALVLGFPWQAYNIKINSLDHIFVVVKNDYDIESDTTFMLRSIDEGVTWDTVFADSIYIHELIFDKNNQLYLATEKGVYFSDDNGDSWIEMNQGLEVLEVTNILIDSTGILYATPLYAGVWKYDLMVSTKSIDPTPELSVYPNPSMGIITINLPGKMLTSNTRLDIFNIQGMLVKSIPVMNSQLTVDISDLLPGSYLVNVTGIKKGQIVIVK